MAERNATTRADAKNARRFKDRETLNWVVSQFRGTLVFLIVASLGQTVSSGVSVLSAFYSRDIVDAAVDGSRERFFAAAAALLGLLVWSLATLIFNHAVSERLYARAEVALQKRAFATLLRKDFTATTSRHSGDSLNRLTSDVKVVCAGASSIVPALVSLISRLVFAFAALYYFDPVFALVFLGVGVSVFTITLFFRKRLKALHRAMQEAEGKKRSFWQEALENLFVVKVFSNEAAVERRSTELIAAHYKATMRRRNFGLIAGGGFNALFSFAYLAALVWQAWLVLTGASTFGALTAVLQLVGNVQSPFAGLSSLIPRYYSTLASAERVRELEELPDESGADVEPLDPNELHGKIDALVFERVSFKYERDGKDVEVFNDASFELAPNENVVVRGRSGIGKSSLFKLLTGVCRPNAGRIYLRLRDGTEIPVDRRTRALFACVPQGNMLFSGSVEENVAFFQANADPDALRRALRVADAQFIDETRERLATTLGEKGAGLSEGQAQRVAIARAVFSDAPVLLLDEATSALDEEAERRVLTNLIDARDKTLILVSHRPAALAFVERAATIEDGRVQTTSNLPNGA